MPVILATGLCPNTLQTFFNQQHRWCSGSMSLLFSRKFWRERIGLRARLTFVSGMTYFLYTALALVFAPLPAVLMVWAFPDEVFWWDYLLLVPALLRTRSLRTSHDGLFQRTCPRPAETLAATPSPLSLGGPDEARRAQGKKQ